MPRIRSIKPEFWADEKLAPLAPIDRLVFLGLMSLADDAGRLIDSVRQLDGLVFPLTDDTCGPSLDALARLGRIRRYTSQSGQRLIQVVNWERHQKVTHPSKHVLPPPSCDPPEDFTRTAGDPRASTLDLGPWTLDQLHGADRIVENSGPPPTPPSLGDDLPPVTEPTGVAFTRGQLLAEARETCGLNTWNRDEEKRANSVLVTWYGQDPPLSPDRIHAAIHGARMLVDRGKVDWIKPRHPFGLRALNNTLTLADQGHGERCVRLLFDVAEETYYRAMDSPAPRGRRGGMKTAAQLLGGVA